MRRETKLAREVFHRQTVWEGEVVVFDRTDTQNPNVVTVVRIPKVKKIWAGDWEISPVVSTVGVMGLGRATAADSNKWAGEWYDQRSRRTSGGIFIFHK